jgi:diaminohydroxyphosphoribosylaminopyrimidine deaminase/5-amino-6-(5-phosphoribosylamino)uracil reductase
MPKAADERYMEEALALAAKGEGHTRPNPPVGAVLVCGGKVVGRGWHKKCGGDHAEVAAIKNASARPSSCHSTLYVTLEPCSKPGRVGACTDAIVAAGIERVVYAVDDPNPRNRGRAKRVLARAGISCERLSVNSGAARKAARLIAPFAKHVTTGLPFVTVKIAMSLDGRISDDFGDARWISSSRARAMTGRMRERVDAIMVGAETVRRDNPSLLCHTKRNDDLVRVVISRSGRLPKSAQIFTDGAANKMLVYSDAREALEELGRMGVMHVLCEGGLSLATSLAEAGFVDEWLTVLAPVVVGKRHIADAVRPFEAKSASTIDGDAMCLYSRRSLAKKSKRRMTCS